MKTASIEVAGRRNTLFGYFDPEFDLLGSCELPGINA